jgi:hypothetical protein
VEKHTTAAIDPSLSLLFSPSETSDALETLAAAFWEFPATVGVAAGAR